jgi:hypothetical protein
MNSFTSIAASKNTSLAVVAPASRKRCSPPPSAFSRDPRVLAYNKLQGEVAKLQSRLEGFADEFSAISRGRSTSASRSRLNGARHDDRLVTLSLVQLDDAMPWRIALAA